MQEFEFNYVSWIKLFKSLIVRSVSPEIILAFLGRMRFNVQKQCSIISAPLSLLFVASTLVAERIRLIAKTCELIHKVVLECSDEEKYCE